MGTRRGCGAPRYRTAVFPGVAHPACLLPVAGHSVWLAGMTDLGPVPWPPAPIRTERLLLRAAEARDRATFVELYGSQEVHTYLGGARPREELEREMPEVPGHAPGSFVVERDGAMIGQILLRRATKHRPAAVGKVDLGYLFLPRAWGFGYAAEACGAALDWLADVLPGEPVVLATQTANTRSLRLAATLGFTEVERFRAWEAEQWLGLRPAVSA
ncbi:Protein N-acetyltransferase, RimJ/RimL family [Streptomyces sp. di188]|nr:Protein N-acetyltransferase, RimJ/RimL family [Streptomyces sp. di188]SCD46778.1 Protein N-acetyltransferase, RimJ/RimL family [Streptomyces sp. di50b]